MGQWMLALLVGVATVVLVAIAAAAGLRAEGIMVAIIAAVFLGWAALWSAGRLRRT